MIRPQKYKKQANIKKQNFIKLKGFCIAKKIINRAKRQNREKYLIARICKKLKQLNSKRKQNPQAIQFKDRQFKQAFVRQTHMKEQQA